MDVNQGHTLNMEFVQLYTTHIHFLYKYDILIDLFLFLFKKSYKAALLTRQFQKGLLKKSNNSN